MGNNREKMEISWHLGFYGAMELELISDKGLFEFQREYNLGKELLRMDLLIIRKQSETPVENEIGRLFRKYNIVEYKSPEDGLSIDDYYKTIGYACLYKGLGERIDQIPAEDLTISIFRDRYPRKLFQALRKEGLLIEEAFPGIYYIKGKTLFDTQIIISSRLQGAAHRSLRLISLRAKREDVQSFIEETAGVREPGDINNIEAVLQVSIAANRKLYDGMRRKLEMFDALRDFFKEEIQAEIKEGIKEGIEAGIKESVEEKTKVLTLETIKNLMANMTWTPEQAMEAMSIPAENWEFYKARL